MSRELADLLAARESYLAGRRAALAGGEQPHPDPLDGTWGAPMQAFSRSELELPSRLEPWITSGERACSEPDCALRAGHELPHYLVAWLFSADLRAQVRRARCARRPRWGQAFAAPLALLSGLGLSGQERWELGLFRSGWWLARACGFPEVLPYEFRPQPVFPARRVITPEGDYHA